MVARRPRSGAYAWSPPAGRGFHLLPIGAQFEAVRAPADLGAWMRTNGTEKAAHIATAQHAIWLLPAEEAAAYRTAWRVPGVRHVASGLLAVPQAGRPEAGAGVRWVVPRGWKGRHVANPSQLATDLAAAARAAWGGGPGEYTATERRVVATPDEEYRPRYPGTECHPRN